jgi:two-component system, LuxR family, sensor kinase FixL
VRLRSRLVSLWHRAFQNRREAPAGEHSGRHGDLQLSNRDRVQDLENELAQFARLAPMNLLASTLAHELGQPLAAVANYVSGAHRLIMEGDAPKLHLIEQALTAAAVANQRSSDIVRSMRSMIADGCVHRQPESVVSLIERASLLAMADVDDHAIDFRVEIDRDVDTIYVDRIQVEQVFINLLRNAVDAIAPMPVRKITLAARLTGAEVNINLSDSGPGVAPEIQDKLFYAFNSTKRDGLGVGLSICRTMVEANGGRISYGPAPGGGACFTVCLPTKS